MEKESIIISEGERPIWQMIIAAFFYTLCIFLIGYFFYTFQFTTELKIVKRSNSLFKLAFMAFMTGIGFSTKNIKFFNLEEKKYKNQYSVGPFKVGKWKALPKLDYVSVFKNPKDIFEINIWHNRNKHFNIYNYFEKEEALKTGYYIANQLHIKLLDATKPNNYTYLDMNELKEKYKS